jgi:exopolysaccharide biosynthesis polyprenyl glycosylphosphotransferase
MILFVLTRSIPRALVLAALVIVPLLIVSEKWAMQKTARRLRRTLGFTRKAVIVGTGSLGRKVFSTLVRSPKIGIDPIAFVTTYAGIDDSVIYESSYQHKRLARVLAGPITPQLLHKLGAKALILAEPDLLPEEVASIRTEAEAAGIMTYVIPEPFLDEAATEYVEMDGVLLACTIRRCERRTYKAAKRVLDVAFSLLVLLAASPILAAAAIAIHVSSPGPIIFRQQRVGRNGRRFTMYKFRTMHTDCAIYARSPISARDFRITRVGRWLRHTCIDELPQLFNVLRGDMSLVGPRPEMPFLVEQYEAIHLKRLSVLPGLTGLWQLSADRMSPIHQNISYDEYYIRHRSLLLDLAILLHTVVFAFRGV